jgi:hypothetical protein
MKTIQRIGVFFLLLVFLFGTTGISVFHHVCSSSNQDNVSVYPEFFKKSGSSCCADEETGYACSQRVNTSGEALAQHIDASPCCISIFSFFKLDILTVRADKLLIKDVLIQIPDDTDSIITDLPENHSFIVPCHFQFFSPPLFGKVLVYFLHQMKIPVRPSFI